MRANDRTLKIEDKDKGEGEGEGSSRGEELSLGRGSFVVSMPLLALALALARHGSSDWALFLRWLGLHADAHAALRCAALSYGILQPT